jgi:hypothetical protein
MDITGIITKVTEDRKANYHTNSAHPIDANGTEVAQLQSAFPDCRVYVATMVTGISDRKTFIEERVRHDLKKLCENPRLCVVVDWSSL